jgi:hypothetical protein
MKRQELPEGVAAYFIHGDGMDVHGNDTMCLDTVCLLVKADGELNNNLPSTVSKWEVLSAGIAFFSPGDLPESRDREKGEVISLGRALKAYHNNKTVIRVTDYNLLLGTPGMSSTLKLYAG